jgi:hypothetical protein
MNWYHREFREIRSSELEQEKLNSKGGHIAEHMTRHDLVVLDELATCHSPEIAGNSCFT